MKNLSCPWKASRVRRALAMAALPWFALLIGLGCAGESNSELGSVKGRTFKVVKADREQAVVISEGCAFNERDARDNARRIAQYHLRGVTGAAEYRVVYRFLGSTEDSNRICVEMEATAVPNRRF